MVVGRADHAQGVRISDTDGADVDAHDADPTAAERVRTVEVLRLRADALHPIDVPEQVQIRIQLPTQHQAC